jgi:hypothetical protein
MTHDKGIMEIFRQNESFSMVLIVWGAKVQVLII